MKEFKESKPKKEIKDFDLRVSRDLVKDAVFTKVERNIELPVILQTLENKAFTDDFINAFGSLFEYEIGRMQHSKLDLMFQMLLKIKRLERIKNSCC